MLTPEEENFLKYWAENRNKSKRGIKQYRVGLSIGLVLGIGIIINLMSGWYSRANMVANSQSTPIILVLGIIIISVFCSFFYQQFKKEANEQRYKELIFKKEKENLARQVQQNEAQDGQNNK